MYAEKDTRISELLCILFCARQNSMSLSNGVQILLIVLNSARRGTVVLLEIASPPVLEVSIFFHSIAIKEKAIQGKAMKWFRSNSIGTRIGYIV